MQEALAKLANIDPCFSILMNNLIEVISEGHELLNTILQSK